MNNKILVKYILGECDVAQSKKVEEALKSSSELQKEYAQLLVTYSIVNDLNFSEAIDTKVAYKRTKKKILLTKRKSFFLQITRYAAFLSIPLLISTLVFGYLYLMPNKVEQQFAEVTSAPGTIVKYELPDKSIVYLNSESKLRYPTQFSGDKREVELDGEAYFKVTSDKENPFYVNTPTGLTVYVYGTHFDVNAYKEEKYVETVLEEGRVNVITPDRKTEMKLAPGERIYYNKQTNELKQSKVDVYAKTAWKDGKLIFRNEELSTVLKRLARRHNIDIELVNHSNKRLTYRATFTNEHIYEILDYLSKSANMTWKVNPSLQMPNGTFTKRKIIVNLY